MFRIQVMPWSDMGDDAYAPMLCEAHSRGIFSKIIGALDPSYTPSSAASRTAWLEFLSMPVDSGLQAHPHMTWKRLCTLSDETRPIHVIAGPFSETLTPQAAAAMQLKMVHLVEAGLTWDDVAASRKPASWFVDVLDASFRDFEALGGTIEKVTWVREDIDDALERAHAARRAARRSRR